MKFESGLLMDVNVGNWLVTVEIYACAGKGCVDFKTVGVNGRGVAVLPIDPDELYNKVVNGLEKAGYLPNGDNQDTYDILIVRANEMLEAQNANV